MLVISILLLIGGYIETVYGTNIKHLIIGLVCLILGSIFAILYEVFTNQAIENLQNESDLDFSSSAIGEDLAVYRTCRHCNQTFDIEDCETDKYWSDPDNQGVMHHLMLYQCPHCKEWLTEDELI